MKYEIREHDMMLSMEQEEIEALIQYLEPRYEWDNAIHKILTCQNEMKRIDGMDAHLLAKACRDYLKAMEESFAKDYFRPHDEEFKRFAEDEEEWNERLKSQ